MIEKFYTLAIQVPIIAIKRQFAIENVEKRTFHQSISPLIKRRLQCS